MSEAVTPETKKKSRNPGGWLLVEVTLGGVMASVALGALLVNVGDAMDKSAIVGRKLTAQMLAKQGIEQVRALDEPQTRLADGTANVPVASTVRGSYTRSRTVTSGTTTVGAQSLQYKDITITVAFPNKSGAKTVSMQTRIYDPN